ncbi:MAG TPA: DHA2 family efflux MFS transporter permease subunit [Solirubrobacteraceae bacterium]|nr:DHA2 family efflux MFS transporter permease subunit [Solirubrobacteraceae bacterium]
MTQSARLLLLAAGAAFLALLDVTVVNLAIPALGRAYPDSSVSSLSWVITAYATVFAALLAPAGRLADVIGRRALFRAGVGGFALMSAACAAAPSVPVLLAARALQGAAAAAMIPASLAIVLTDTPAERRTASIGLWSAAGAFAAAVGPSVGGVLVHAFGWRSLFVINVPTGVALAAFARMIPNTPRQDARLPDPVGTVLLAAGVGLAALGLSQGARWGWGDARTVAALAGGVTAAGVALQRSWRVPVPAIETRLWRHRTFALANATSLLYGTSLYAWMLLGVLVLTQLWHYSELQAGLAMTPGAITASIAAIIGGRARGRTGPRTITVIGTLTMAACGLVLATTLPHHPDFLGYWLPIGLVLGTGMGLVTTGTSTAAALSLPATSFAAGTGLNQTARQVGGALGIATLATLLPARPSGSATTFEHVYLFCALVILCGAFVALGLTLRPVTTAVATEKNDPYLASPPRIEHSPWSRFVVVGDSMAEGVGDPTPGYEHLGWADRVARTLHADYLNLGRRNLLAAEVRETQLERALAFAPDLAAVVCGGNDLMRPDHDPVAVERHVDAIVAALRAAGSDVIMFAPFDMSQSDLLPADRRTTWRSLIERMGALAERVARRQGGVLVDFRSHPAGPESSIYSNDRIHLNARGHAICAAQTLRALERRAAERQLKAA